MNTSRWFPRIALSGIVLTALASLAAVSHAQSSVTTTLSYNARGNVTSVTDGKGRTAGATYDNLGRLTGVSLPDGLSQTVEYLPRHLIDRVNVDPIGAGSLLTTSFQYDARRQRTRTTDPSGDFAQFAYDDRGWLQTVYDGEDRRTENAYLPDGKLYCIRGAYGTPLQQSSRRMAWSFWDEPVSYYSPRGVDANCQSLNDAYRSQASVDSYGRIYKLEFPDLTREQSTLLKNGQPSQEFNRANDLTTITYDDYSRVLSRRRDVASPPGSTTRVYQDEQVYAYDKEGRVTSITRNYAASTSVVLAYAYDSMGRMLSETRTEGAAVRTVGFRYDQLGNQTAIIWPDNWTARYVYDVNGRLKEVWADPNGIAACTSLPHVCGDGVTGDGDEKLLASYGYNVYGRLDKIEYGGTAGAAASVVEYTYQPDGDIEQMRHVFAGETGANAEVTFTYDYDKSGKLISSGSSDTGWLWDGTGKPAATYAAANTLDQYPSVTESGSTRTFGYDLYGNLSSISGGPEGTRQYAHNVLGQMVQATGSAFSATYKYDPMDRRMSVSGTGTGVTAKSWIHAGSMEIAEYSSAGSLLRRFVPGTSIDQHVAMIEAGGATYFYHPDRLGHIIALSVGTVGSPDRGDLSDKYVYTPFGVQLPLVSSANPFRYTGRRADPETGNYYYRARYYDAGLGRFIEPDPIGYADQMNLYAYVENDPLNATDPTGMVTLKCEVIAQPSPGAGQLGTVTVNCRRETDGSAGVNVVATGSISGSGLFPPGTSQRYITEGLIAEAGAQQGWGPPAFTHDADDPFGMKSEVDDSCEMHHCIPSQILKQLRPEVRRAVQYGNLLSLPKSQHRGAGVGVHSQGYNARWQELVLIAGGAQNLSAAEVLAIDAIVRKEFDLPPR